MRERVVDLVVHWADFSEEEVEEACSPNLSVFPVLFINWIIIVIVSDRYGNVWSWKSFRIQWWWIWRIEARRYERSCFYDDESDDAKSDEGTSWRWRRRWRWRGNVDEFGWQSELAIQRPILRILISGWHLNEQLL
jgi:hypothetical protein